MISLSGFAITHDIAPYKNSYPSPIIATHKGLLFHTGLDQREQNAANDPKV
jgi:hypothetical protein